MRRQRLVELWHEHGAALLARWIAERPGTRPWAWWEIDAPEPRRRLGGRGVVVSERIVESDATALALSSPCAAS